MINQEIYWENRKTKGEIIYKKCSTCGLWFPETIEYFYMRNKQKPHLGFVTQCKKCSIKYSQNYYDSKRHTELTNFYYHNNSEYKKRKKSYNYTEKEKQRQAQWRKNNPEKIAEYNAFRLQHKTHNINKNEWEACKAYFDFSCAYCGITENESVNQQGQKLHKEHVNSNGENDLSNCIPSCRICNSSKHTLQLDEFYNEDNPNFTEERYNRIMNWIYNDYEKYIK